MHRHRDGIGAKEMKEIERSEMKTEQSEVQNGTR
jgi:hypothetical protein